DYRRDRQGLKIRKSRNTCAKRRTAMGSLSLGNGCQCLKAGGQFSQDRATRRQDACGSRLRGNSWQSDDARPGAGILEGIAEKLGLKPVLYSGHLIKEKLGNKKDPFFGAHRLWLAHYSPNPTVQKSWTRYWLWQTPTERQAYSLTRCPAFRGTLEATLIAILTMERERSSKPSGRRNYAAIVSSRPGGRRRARVGHIRAGKAKRSSRRVEQRCPRASARSSAAMVRARPGSSSSIQVRSADANRTARPCARSMPLGPAAEMPAAASIHCCERTASALIAIARPGLHAVERCSDRTAALCGVSSSI